MVSQLVQTVELVQTKHPTEQIMGYFIGYKKQFVL